MEENIFGIEFDFNLGNAEVLFETLDYRDIPNIYIDDLLNEKSKLTAYRFGFDT